MRSTSQLATQQRDHQYLVARPSGALHRRETARQRRIQFLVMSVDCDSRGQSFHPEMWFFMLNEGRMRKGSPVANSATQRAGIPRILYIYKDQKVVCRYTRPTVECINANRTTEQ